MTLTEYQSSAMTTCMPSCENLSYMLLNLQGEVGEFSSKIAKAIRRGEVCIVDNALKSCNISDEDFDTLMTECEKELGDCLWQLAGLAKVLGFELGAVAEQNLEKLASRARRNVIAGDGDNR